MNSTPPFPPCQNIFAPGRVNLIGEHIDYHRLPVLPVALDRGIRLRWRSLPDGVVRYESTQGYAAGEFGLAASIERAEAGHWSNYLRAAAQATVEHWKLTGGIAVEVSSDLPPASGLSSSSALVVAATLALLEANGVSAGLEELMAVLPEAEHYVGTRGGGMDHAICLAGRRGEASLIEFAPVLRVTQIPLPRDWALVLMDSGVRAEKSAGVREAYNERRRAGAEALRLLGFDSYRAALDAGADSEQRGLPELERRCFRHVMREARRVETACQALRQADLDAFAAALNESHASLRDDLGVSCRELDGVVEYAVLNGARGARLTGAGFGGYALAVVEANECDRFLDAMRSGYSDSRVTDPDFLMKVTAGNGALKQQWT
jgi:galactokinase